MPPAHSRPVVTVTALAPVETVTKRFNLTENRSPAELELPRQSQAAPRQRRAIGGDLPHCCAAELAGVLENNWARIAENAV